MSSAYEVLRVPKHASLEKIKESYIKQVKRYPPETETDKFMEIKAAYDKLRDPQTRAKEDILCFNEAVGGFHLSEESKKFGSISKLNEEIEELEKKGQTEPLGPDDDIRLSVMLQKRAVYYLQNSKWSEAIGEWEKALKLDSENNDIRANIKYACSALGFSYGTHDMYLEAIEVWEKGLGYDVNDKNLIHNLAIANEKRADPDKAGRYWNKIMSKWREELNSDPDNEYLKSLIVASHQYLGDKYKLDQSTKEAIEEYKEIVKIEPDSTEANFKLAINLMENENWSEAKEVLQKILTKSPKDSNASNALGWAFMNTGKVEDAFLTWNKILRRDPKNSTAKENIIKGHLAVGKKFREQGLYSPALVHFKSLQRYMPKQPEVLFEIGSTYAAKGDTGSAMVQMNKILSIDPNHKLAKKMLNELKRK
jgi:tetratricopeptide (TPR) repeat protein